MHNNQQAFIQMYVNDQINGYKAETSKENVNKRNKEMTKWYTPMVWREVPLGKCVMEFRSFQHPFGYCGNALELSRKNRNFLPSIWSSDGTFKNQQGICTLFTKHYSSKTVTELFVRSENPNTAQQTTDDARSKKFQTSNTPPSVI